MWEQWKERFWELKSDFALSALVVLSLFAAFGLMRTMAPAQEKETLAVTKLNVPPPSNPEGKDKKFLPRATALFLASFNGSKYYPKNCPAASRIKEESRIWFATQKEASEAGYEPSIQCSY